MHPVTANVANSLLGAEASSPTASSAAARTSIWGTSVAKSQSDRRGAAVTASSTADDAGDPRATGPAVIESSRRTLGHAAALLQRAQEAIADAERLCARTYAISHHHRRWPDLPRL